MKLGINLYLWTDQMHDGLMPVLESLKQIGYDGVEVPVFDLDEATWAQWGQRLDDLGLQRTANTVIAPEWNPLSPDPAVQEAAYQHMQAVIDCCAAVGSTLLCGPHQVALGVFTGAGPTDEEWARSVGHLRRVAEYAAAVGVTLAEEVVNRFELYHLNTLDEGIRFVDEVDHPQLPHPPGYVPRPYRGKGSGGRHPACGEPHRSRSHFGKRPGRAGNGQRRLGLNVRCAPGHRLRRLAHRGGIRQFPPQSRRRHQDLAKALR